ncbi:beta-1,3-galactosyltransferase 5-like [Lissotriton helveticus]
MGLGRLVLRRSRRSVVRMFAKVQPLILWFIKHRCCLLLLYLSAAFIVLIILLQEPLYHGANQYHRILNSSDYILLPRKNCKDIDPFVIILVSSSPGQRRARSVIRSTWASVTHASGKPIRTVFLLGTRYSQKMQDSLASEHAVFDDLVQKDFFDSYSNLILKTLMGFQWVSEYCPRAEYIMKVDSDVFVNVWRLVQLLMAAIDLPFPLYTGSIHLSVEPIRNPLSKFYVSWAEYPDDVFPPYCPSWSYIVSGELAPALLAIAPFMPPLKLEDVFVGLCLEQLDVEPTTLGYRGYFLENVGHDVCLYRSLVSSHGVQPRLMQAVWTAFLKPGRHRCLEKEVKRQS